MFDRPRDPDSAETLNRRVLRLEALEGIRALKATYFTCVDTRDWTRFRQLFTDDCVFESEFMTAVGSPDEFVEMIQALILPGRSAHAGYSPLLTIEDDNHAAGTWAMYDRVELDPAADRSSWEGYGFYVERYVRATDGWRISHWRLDRTIIHRLT